MGGARGQEQLLGFESQPHLQLAMTVGQSACLQLRAKEEGRKGGDEGEKGRREGRKENNILQRLMGKRHVKVVGKNTILCAGNFSA